MFSKVNLIQTPQAFYREVEEKLQPLLLEQPAVQTWTMSSYDQFKLDWQLLIHLAHLLAAQEKVPQLSEIVITDTIAHFYFIDAAQHLVTIACDENSIRLIRT